MRSHYRIWFAVTLAGVAVFTAGVAYRHGFSGGRGEPSKVPTLIRSSSSKGGVSNSDSPQKEHELKALLTQLESKPNHVPILLRLAEVSREMRRGSDSARYLKDAVKSDPKNVDARLELGRALFETGDVDGALRETERILETQPDNIDALYNLGAIYGNMNDEQRAREYWTRAISLGGDSPSGRLAKQGLAQLSSSRTPR